MSELESKKKIGQAEKPLDQHADMGEQQTFNASERNVDASKINEIQNANPDRHTGSAGGDQDHSIEIVGFGATVSRKTKLTEKDLAKDVTKGAAKDAAIEGSSWKEAYVLKGRVEENAIAPPAVLERLAALPLDKQAQIIGAGIAACQQELDHQRFRTFVGAVAGVGDGLVGLAEGVEGLGKAVCDVAQFSREVMGNDPAAASKAAKAGEVVGKVLVGGVRLWQVTDAYLGGIGATGDYAKPLKDIAWLGQQIDQRWQAMSPEEKSKLTAKLAVENLAGLAVGFGTAKLAKSMKVTEALEQLGADASQLGSGARDKAGRFISKMLDELMPQEIAVTPDGQRIAIPRTPRELPGNAIEPKSPRDTALFSMSDDLGESSSRLPDRLPKAKADHLVEAKPKIRDSDAEVRAAIEKFPPSEKFVAQLGRVIESLEPDELEFLKAHDINIAAVRRITDVFIDRNPKTLGVYDPKSKTIYLAEEMQAFGHWCSSNDLMFGLRHEFGHAFNATSHPLGDWVSDRRKFIEAFNRDFVRLTPQEKSDLMLSPAHRERISDARDEVFADMYAHASGLKSNNGYSQKMKVAFPNCLQYLKEEL